MPQHPATAPSLVAALAWIVPLPRRRELGRSACGSSVDLRYSVESYLRARRMPPLAMLPRRRMRRPAAAPLEEPAAPLAYACTHHLFLRPPGGSGLPGEATSSQLRSACGQMASQLIVSIFKIVRINMTIEKGYFVNTLVAYAKDTMYINLGTFGGGGGATLSVEPTPRKRGPLPKPIWRRGRLPNFLARPRRPPFPWNLQLPCRYFHDALRLNLERTLQLESVVAAARARGC